MSPRGDRPGRRFGAATVGSSMVIGVLLLVAALGPSADPGPSARVVPVATSTTSTTSTTTSTSTTSTSTSTTSTSTTSTSTTSTTSTTVPPPVLVWADEFHGAAGQLPDAARWRSELGGHGWGNAQLEFTDDAHARLDGRGHLAITSEPLVAEAGIGCWYGPCRFVSSRLTTDGLFAHRYGRIEMRASLPRGDATWPAFWMLGVDRAAVGWPASGEIDVLEHVGRDGDEVHGAVHGPGYSGGDAIVGSTGVDDVTSFHVYAVEWTAAAIEWSVDGRPYHRVERDEVPTWPFDRPFHLIVNLAIGGTLGGDPTEADLQPHSFVIDHVRVYDLSLLTSPDISGIAPAAGSLKVPSDGRPRVAAVSTFPQGHGSSAHPREPSTGGHHDRVSRTDARFRS